jgi:hypothetical protein
MGKNKPGRPDYTHSVGGLIDEGVEVRAWCDTCMAKYVVVDLGKIAEARGRDFTLWNKRSRCRLTEDCKGTIGFYYQAPGMMARLAG